VYRIEIFGGYLPVVTIDRDKVKTAGNCKTNQSHVTDPVSYLFNNLLFKTKYPDGNARCISMNPGIILCYFIGKFCI